HPRDRSRREQQGLGQRGLAGTAVADEGHVADLRGRKRLHSRPPAWLVPTGARGPADVVDLSGRRFWHSTGRAHQGATARAGGRRPGTGKAPWYVCSTVASARLGRITGAPPSTTSAGTPSDQTRTPREDGRERAQHARRTPPDPGVAGSRPDREGAGAGQG